MLENLDSLGNTRFILLKDNIKQSGQPLLRAILRNCLKLSQKVTVVLYETSPESFISRTEVEHYRNNLQICQPDLEHLMVSDTGQHADPSGLKDLLDHFQEGTIFLDSLSLLLAVCSASQLYRTIHKLLLNTKVKQLIILAHEDTQDESVLVPFEHLSSLVVSLSPPDAGNPMAVRAHITGWPTGKKLINRHECFTIDSDGKISSKEIKPYAAQLAAPFEVDLSNLTFNLGIKKDEMAAREKLVLPYTQVASSESLSSGGGEIHYQPDAADDFDEEDPDNDLNI